jgi:hypothetical protein
LFALVHWVIAHKVSIDLFEYRPNTGTYLTYFIDIVCMLGKSEEFHELLLLSRVKCNKQLLYIIMVYHDYPSKLLPYNFKPNYLLYFP